MKDKIINVELGQVYKVVNGAFTGLEGVLLNGFNAGCYFIEESNGDRSMVTASQIEKVLENKNHANKPNVYKHLTDYQYALQQLLNCLSIFISVGGRKLNVDSFMPLSISQILLIEKLYNIENTINSGDTSYMLNIKPELVGCIKESEHTLKDIIC
jgi:hypothetical protein